MTLYMYYNKSIFIINFAVKITVIDFEDIILLFAHVSIFIKYMTKYLSLNFYIFIIFSINSNFNAEF